MAYSCPQCGQQYDATLFEFGRKVRCSCGALVDIHKGHRREVGRPGPRKSPAVKDIDDECVGL